MRRVRPASVLAMALTVLAAVTGATVLIAPIVVGAPASARAAGRPAGDALAVQQPAAQTRVGPAPGDVQDFAFQSLDVDYTLTRTTDGASRLRVVERFVAVFPDSDQNHGLRRAVPERYNGMPLHPRLVSVTDGEGHARGAETESSDGFLVVTSRADGFVHGAQTYVFTYDLENVTWPFHDTGADEFYWDVNGTGWPQPFARVSAAVHLDAALAAARTERQACYRGAEGSTEQCAIAAQDAATGGVVVRAEAVGLGPFQTMTIAIGFTQGTFAPFDSSYFGSVWGWLQALSVLLMVAAVGWALVLRLTRLRDARGRGVVVAEYEPPAELDALQGAVLLGRSGKAIPAEILEQAVAGSLRIVEAGRSAFGKVKLQAQLIDAGKADGDGRMLLHGLFGEQFAAGETFDFGRRDTRLASAAQRILLWAKQELVRRGLRVKVPARVRALPVLAAVAGAAGTLGFGLLATEAGVTQITPGALVLLTMPVLVAVIGLVGRRPLTADGAVARERMLGLKLFIEWAEADRIRMLQSPSGAERVPVSVQDPTQMLRLYESLLPWAVVFGQERQWSAQLAVMYPRDQSPGWYVGSHGFDARAFASGVAGLSASAASASSSSSSGGSGGGGSAGGGGGGGGGGGV